MDSAAKTQKVSRGLANKFDILDLLENDSEFAQLWLSGEVRGVQDFKRMLKSRQSNERKGFVTFNGAQYSQVNRDVVQQAQMKQIENLRLQQRI